MWFRCVTEPTKGTIFRFFSEFLYTFTMTSLLQRYATSYCFIRKPVLVWIGDSLVFHVYQENMPYFVMHFNNISHPTNIPQISKYYINHPLHLMHSQINPINTPEQSRWYTHTFEMIDSSSLKTYGKEWKEKPKRSIDRTIGLHVCLINSLYHYAHYLTTVSTSAQLTVKWTMFQLMRAWAHWVQCD